MGSATTFMLVTGFASMFVMVHRHRGRTTVVAPEGIAVDDLSRLVRAACTPAEVQSIRDLIDGPTVAEVPQRVAATFRDRPLGPHVWVDADGICRTRCASDPAA